jgi:hypothetical protein
MLTLRVIVEGAAGAGTSTVIELLGSQQSAEVERISFNEGHSELHRVTYEAGNFEGAKIRIEVAALKAAPAESISAMRRRCDAIVVVVDSLPDGINTGRQHFGQLVGELVEYSAKVRPVVAVFAHHQDRPGACPPSEVAAGLRSEPLAEVVGTSSSLSSVRYGMAFVVARAVGALELREAAGRQRNQPETIDELFQLLHHGADAATSEQSISDHAQLDSAGSVIGDELAVDPSAPGPNTELGWPAPTVVSSSDPGNDPLTEDSVPAPAAGDGSIPADTPAGSAQLDRLARRGALRRLKASLRISADPPEQ